MTLVAIKGRCDACGALFEQPATGRPRRWCRSCPPTGASAPSRRVLTGVLRTRREHRRAWSAARYEATTELIRRHRDEFADLMCAALSRRDVA